MKSYTDLQQSRKLAEILPLESADMFWLVLGNIPRVHVLTEPLSNYSPWESSPCWSLSALLNIIKGKCEYYELVYLKNTSDGRANRLENVHRLSTDIYDVYKEELIDACVEMIERLYNENL